MTFDEWYPLRPAAETPDPDLAELLHAAMREAWDAATAAATKPVYELAIRWHNIARDARRPSFGGSEERADTLDGCSRSALVAIGRAGHGDEDMNKQTVRAD